MGRARVSASNARDHFQNCSVIIFVSEQTSHVHVLGLLLLLLNGGGRVSGSTTSGGDGGGGAGRGDGGEEVSDVGVLEGLGEEGRPVALDGVVGGLDNCVQLLSLSK